jgi:hypothetical protein
MHWRSPVQTMFDQNVQSGSSLNSSVLDYAEVLDNHFSQIEIATEVGNGQTLAVMWGSLNSHEYYPLTSSAGTNVTGPGATATAAFLQATGVPARYVYVQVIQSNNEVQQVTITQTGM